MPLVGTVRGGGGGLGPTTKVGRVVPATEGIGKLAIVAAGYVRITSPDLGGAYADLLLNTEGIQEVGGGPRHDVSERIGRTSVAEYRGHDPLEIMVSVIIDGYEDGDYTRVLNAWRLLLSMTERVPDQHRVPTILLQGGSVPGRYEGRKWLANGPLEQDNYPTPIYRQLLEGTAPLRLPFTMSLIQKVPDPLLRESISESRRNDRGEGFNAKTTKARQGEDNFGDVSKRVYGTRNRAVEIATANHLPLGFKLKKGQKVRLPQ